MTPVLAEAELIALQLLFWTIHSVCYVTFFKFVLLLDLPPRENDYTIQHSVLLVSALKFTARHLLYTVNYIYYVIASLKRGKLVFFVNLRCTRVLQTSSLEWRNCLWITYRNMDPIKGPPDLWSTWCSGFLRRKHRTGQ